MGPFVKSKNETKKMMLHLIISLLPIIAFTIYKHGYIPYINNKITFFQMFYPLMLVIIGSLTSFLTEFIYAISTKKRMYKEYIKDGYSFFPGLFLALIIPLNLPIYLLIIGAFIASFSKIIFGGFGKNVFNPALIGYLVIGTYVSFFVTTSYLNPYELDTISSPTPLTNASMASGIGSYNELVKPYGSLFNFFVGTIPGSLAETSSLLCLLAFIYLALTKTIKWRIPATYVLTVLIITFGIGRLLDQELYFPLFHVLSGGLLFGAVFMATDPVTSAVTPVGQVLQGLFLGILTVVLRFTGVEGVATSILIVNMLVFIFDKTGAKARFNFTKSIVWFLLYCILILGTVFTLATSKKGSDQKDPNFNILSLENINNQVVYVVTQKGYGGLIKAEITFENDKIILIDVISNNETKDRYQMVINDDYFNKLINYQNDLSLVDTVSGATVTCNSFKKMITNVVEDYNEKN